MLLLCVLCMPDAVHMLPRLTMHAFGIEHSFLGITPCSFCLPSGVQFRWRIGFLSLFRGKQPIFSLFLVHFFGFFRGYDDFVQFWAKSAEYFYTSEKKRKNNWLFFKNPQKKPIPRLYARRRAGKPSLFRSGQKKRAEAL